MSPSTNAETAHAFFNRILDRGYMQSDLSNNALQRIHNKLQQDRPDLPAFLPPSPGSNAVHGRGNSIVEAVEEVHQDELSSPAVPSPPSEDVQSNGPARPLDERRQKRQHHREPKDNLKYSIRQVQRSHHNVAIFWPFSDWLSAPPRRPER
ncbi:hypothetical protein LTS18_006125 [Coniosporium uncinatum]|uniref:Uncharacterized protein n=1 Tax=Coniosporium uncinatum TaxID=93489 RepID=A0ACC3D487_9PEZI|nr:hypothetical protein LTS18_006125 [Coniosporium uncinatum]